MGVGLRAPFLLEGIDIKIVHICLAGSYTPNFNYHENLLPKYHMLAGHEVEIIAPPDSFDEHGRHILAKSPTLFKNEDSILVHRLKYASAVMARALGKFDGVYSVLCETDPAAIFVHGCQFIDMLAVMRYVRLHIGVTLFVDNHADFSNSARNWLSRYALHGVLWRTVAHLAAPYVTRFYGVTPGRVDFLVTEYRLPRHSVDLLVMGADDEQVSVSRDPGSREEFRSEWGVGPADFLIVTGGKIDQAKAETLLLMEAVGRIPDSRLRLIIFGSVDDHLKDRFTELLEDSRIQFAGWVRGNASYRFFASAQLAVFPGRHSVYWEQAVGLGVPILVKSWSGLGHVDVGGNCMFLRKGTSEELEVAIRALLESPGRYQKMLAVAEGLGVGEFSYARLAQGSLSPQGFGCVQRPAPHLRNESESHDC